MGYMVIGGPSATLVHAVYMAAITLAGVGYSEIVDSFHNSALRVFNTFVVLFGEAFAVYGFSEVTAFLVEGELHHLL